MACNVTLATNCTNVATVATTTVATSAKNLFAGDNPISGSAHVLALFLLQALWIICVCKALGMTFKYIRQPSVIAEVIAGIILGPSVFGRIPRYMAIVFPDASFDPLNVVANIGLILFLFTIGLELNTTELRKTGPKALAVSISGIILPFTIGVGVAYAMKAILTHDADVGKIPIASFIIFIGTAMSITAFPVLARILLSLDMTNTTVGQITIAAAAIDDVLAWCLLAVVVSIISSTTGLTVLYIILTIVGYIVVLWFLVKPLLAKLIRWQNYEVTAITAVAVFLLAIVSAFYTEIIGIHAFFGGYIAGVCIPKENGFAEKLTERTESVVVSILLPLFFALSGLRTQLGLLDDGQTWGVTFLVLATAMIGKLVGCGFAARLTGSSAREAGAIAFLMNCKGLVEVIVLNVGLQAGVIDARVFTIMIVMAIVMTLITSPVVSVIYPARFHVHLAKVGQASKDSKETDAEKGSASATSLDSSASSAASDSEPAEAKDGKRKAGASKKSASKKSSSGKKGSKKSAKSSTPAGSSRKTRDGSSASASLSGAASERSREASGARSGSYAS